MKFTRITAVQSLKKPKPVRIAADGFGEVKLAWGRLRMAQAEEHGGIRRIDGVAGGGGGGGARHVHPVGAQTGAQAVGLGLEDPAEMIGRPGEVQGAAAHREGEVGRIAGGGEVDHTQYAGGGIEAVGQSGAGGPDDAGEVAGRCRPQPARWHRW